MANTTADHAIRPASSRLFKYLAPIGIVVVVVIGLRLITGGLNARLSIALAIGISLFTLLLGGFLGLFVRNTRFFLVDGQIGTRDYLGRTQVWPLSDVAEARVQSVDFGNGLIPTFLVVSRERRLLIKLPLLSWRRADIERLLADSGLSVKEAAPLSRSAFLGEFPTENPSWTNKRWKQWSLGAFLALALGVGGVAVVLLVNR